MAAPQRAEEAQRSHKARSMYNYMEPRPQAKFRRDEEHEARILAHTERVWRDMPKSERRKND